jgi:uncharacterized protein (TIGR02246 family)
MIADPQIDAVLQQFSERWNAYDTRGLASLFEPDADLTNAFGMTASGREAIEKFHAALFSSLFKNSRFTAEATRMRAIRPDVVMVDLRWNVTGMKVRAENPAGEMNGLMALLLTKHPDGWRITTMHVMQFPLGEPTVGGN